MGTTEVELRAESPGLLSRHLAWLVLDNWPCDGFRYDGVRIDLLQPDGLPAALYEEILAPLDSEDGYLRSAVDWSFSTEEVGHLRDYFTGTAPDAQFCTEPMRPIEPWDCGTGACAFGGGIDFTEHDPPPPVPVWGYYDVRGLEPIRTDGGH